MMLLYVLKGVGVAAIAVVADFAAKGDCLLFVLGVLMLALMWYATHLHARRRAPGRDPA